MAMTSSAACLVRAGTQPSGFDDPFAEDPSTEPLEEIFPAGAEEADFPGEAEQDVEPVEEEDEEGVLGEVY